MANDNVIKIGISKNKDLALYFHTITSEQITLSNDITDHLLEDHTMVQDHITIKPRVFTMRGLIAEKVFEHPNKSGWNQWIENISSKLTPLKVLAPTVNSYLQSAINAYEAIEGKIEQIVQWGQNLWDSRTDINRAWFDTIFSRQDYAYGRWSRKKLQGEILKQLNDLRISRIPVDIYTGWGVNYLEENGEYFYITDVSITQGESYQQSELSVTVKELRFTTTETRPLTAEDTTRFKIQSSNSTNTRVGTKESAMHKFFLKKE